MERQHHSCIWYQNSRLYFTHRPFLPYLAQLPRRSFAKESKQNGTAAEAFCVRAAAVLIRRRLNGAAVGFPLSAVQAGVSRPQGLPRPARARARPRRSHSGTASAALGAREALINPQTLSLRTQSLPAPTGNFLCHPLRKPHGYRRLKLRDSSGTSRPTQ